MLHQAHINSKNLPKTKGIETTDKIRFWYTPHSVLIYQHPFCDPIKHYITDHKKPINVLLKQYQQIRDIKKYRQTENDKVLLLYLSEPLAGLGNQKEMRYIKMFTTT